MSTQNTQNINKQDKYKAIWLSHSSIGDYEKCPRLYYLHNIYKNKNGRKINITSPYMSLGIAVHNVIEDLRNYKSEERLKINLLSNFEKEWEKYIGKIGGFENEEQRSEFKNRGIEMIKNVTSDYKMLARKTISTKSYYDGDMLPNFYISPEENIILCGNVDWIEYIEPAKASLSPADEKYKNGSLKVIDFKTGKNEEKGDSIQLFVYKLLIEKLGCKWPVSGGAYWYFDNGVVVEKDLNDENRIVEIIEKIIKIGIEIRDKKYEWSSNAKFGRAGWIEKKNFVDNFKCAREQAGDVNAHFCDCKKYEKIIKDDPSVEYVGVDMYGKDGYFINSK